MIWYIVIATFLFYGFFSSKPDRHYKISMFVLFIFTAFRDTSLGDYGNTTYIAIFKSAPKLDAFFDAIQNSSLDYESGYMLINSLARTLADDFRFFQVLYTLIAMLLLHIVINKLKFTPPEKNMFLFVYFTMRFIINNFIILRQNIANLIIWNLALSSCGLVLTVILIFASSLFHVTSLANVITLGALNGLKKVNRKNVLIATLITSVVLVTLSGSVINRLVSLFSSLVGEKYIKYFVVEGTTAGFNWIYYFLRIIFFILFYLFYDYIEYESKDRIFLISSLAVILGSINVDIFSRFMEFFMIGIYAIMALSYQVFSEKSRRLYYISFYAALMVIMIRQLIIYGGGYLLDYGFFFS